MGLIHSKKKKKTKDYNLSQIYLKQNSDQKSNILFLPENYYQVSEEFTFNESVTNTTTTHTIFTFTEDSMVVHFFLTGAILDVAPTFIRYSLRITRGSQEIYRIGLHMGARVDGKEINEPVNFPVRAGDVLDIEVFRTLNAVQHRVFGGCTAVKFGFS